MNHAELIDHAAFRHGYKNYLAGCRLPVHSSDNDGVSAFADLRYEDGYFRGWRAAEYTTKQLLGGEVAA